MNEMAHNSEFQPKIFYSEPYIFNPRMGLLGEILQKADLISQKQILMALRDQKKFNTLKIGEVLASYGFISTKTTDFFVEKWPLLVVQKEQHPLGYYLKEAGLLNEKQIASILLEQKMLWLRFGSVAVLKGWLKKTTLEFFLCHLFPDIILESAYRDKRNNLDLKSNNKADSVIINKEELNEIKSPSKKANEKEYDPEDIPWID